MTAKKKGTAEGRATAKSAVTCAWCGASATPTPATWSLSMTERGREEWLCDNCARQNIRSIEGRLDSAWW